MVLMCLRVLQPRQYEQQLFYLACCLCYDIKAVNLANKTALTSISNDLQARHPLAANAPQPLSLPI